MIKEEESFYSFGMLVGQAILKQLEDLLQFLLQINLLIMIWEKIKEREILFQEQPQFRIYRELKKNIACLLKEENDVVLMELLLIVHMDIS